MSASASDLKVPDSSVQLEDRPSRHEYLGQTTSSRPPSKSPDSRGRQYLRTPATVPLRPLSPDTLSQLSVEEYQSLHTPSKPLQHVGSNTRRDRLYTFWIRNLGLLYMLLAQVFGTAMNVTTRILEVEGNNGKGLHPFQVGLL